MIFYYKTADMDLADQRMLCCVWSNGGSFPEDTVWVPTESCRNPNWCVGSALNDLRLDPGCSFMTNPTHIAKQLAKNPLLSCPGWEIHRQAQKRAGISTEGSNIAQPLQGTGWYLLPWTQLAWLQVFDLKWGSLVWRKLYIQPAWWL